MAKFSFCIFTVAVLFGGIVSDMMCAKEEMMNFNPDYFLTDPDKACRDLDTKFDRTRQALKTCFGIEVDMNKVENLHREFCNSNSDYRQKVDRQRLCLSRNLPKSMNCLSNMSKYQSLLRGNILTRSLYYACKSLSVEISNCLVDEVGRPCGAEGLEVYRRMGETMESFFTALCVSSEASAATSHAALIWCILVGLLLAARWW